MKCHFCGAEDTKVTDSRDSAEAFEIRRRRECEKCSKRFTTYERIETHPLVVMKKDGRRESFSKEKLMGGIIKACQKREVGVGEIEEVVREIESSLRNEDTSEISSLRIGELVAARLKKLDKVAYIRFASIYKDFEDVTDFEKEIRSIKK
ncbi:MAG: transcriptional regulator NrdR [Elusimicrobia bacterium GWA2_56_46]|nr:MAG: transcriptional regulator NrdR [Elusimicrobia bacterium GWA2_56_46]OGR56149.1 MAG: transcriptional regulator NrdR [Elusimicrobia bacterium GWC2_56_31]HBB66345.1 transcriptional regulator NrdR [Elusimicrobiota bacterium]HBW23078.1 transcriptional regulator NrdR [Elusimicrobiota bacterium]